ncbi:hypothetical protein PENCOP_c002G06395 [Penicillium coprophilum]|uniref:Uncharacterized protein n=1 Tax=Penicillium coprophilum TaxID=36646 RepID=A0A1V6V2X3_9EURO|nr:hypothetical protein PENCOP_c002G06395 [Penicillium coprophilum]
MYYLGVPIGAGYHMFVFRDEHYQAAIQKLKDSGFPQAPPDRRPAPDILESLPDPQAALGEINRGSERLDRCCTSFQIPSYLPLSGDQVFLIPNSFAHLPLENLDSSYEVYENLFYPLESALVESFVKAVIDASDEAEGSSWHLLLNAWIAMMRGYLEVNNDILDDCADGRAVEWYSTHFGRNHEAEHGVWDLRVSKRRGSGREISHDMRGNPLP